MARADDVMIAFRGVSKVFDDPAAPAVHDLTLDVHDGETLVLVGPSGCGKTTTMKMVNRLIEPSSGTITVGGRDVMEQDAVELRRGIGYVIQNIGLMPHRSVAQNIATIPQLMGWDPKKTSQRVRELATMLELDDALLDRFPSELSGGQRQRVGVARALAADPPVMLMDEPFGAVDPIVRGRLQDQFLDLQQGLEKTIVFVTHDIDEAIKMADRIAILNLGGVIEQLASPEDILSAPANEFVNRFVGAERGLKRLALLQVGDIGLEEGPVVSPRARATEAIEAMDRCGTDWCSVIQDGELLGWIDRTSAAAASSIDAAAARPFSAYVTSKSTLREALDSIVTSRTNVAVVAHEGQRYAGILTLERISREITS